MDDRTKTLMEVVMMTKARMKDQFNEQVDLYRKGEQVGIVTAFSDDQQTRGAQLAASAAYFGADEVVHAAEAWMVSVPPEEADEWFANYQRGDLATNPNRSEALVVSRVTKQTLDILMVPFTVINDELVYAETEDASNSASGLVIDALRFGMREAWRERLAPMKAAKALQAMGLLVMVEDK